MVRWHIDKQHVFKKAAQVGVLAIHRLAYRRNYVFN